MAGLCRECEAGATMTMQLRFYLAGLFFSVPCAFAIASNSPDISVVGLGKMTRFSPVDIAESVSVLTVCMPHSTNMTSKITMLFSVNEMVQYQVVTPVDVVRGNWTSITILVNRPLLAGPSGELLLRIEYTNKTTKKVYLEEYRTNHVLGEFGQREKAQQPSQHSSNCDRAQLASTGTRTELRAIGM